MESIKPKARFQQATISEEETKQDVKQQIRNERQIEDKDVFSRDVNKIGTENKQLLNWAERIIKKYGPACFKESMGDEDRKKLIQKAYIIYDEGLNKKSVPPERYRQYELFAKIKEAATKAESYVHIFLKRDGKYYSPSESEKLNLDILQGPWFIEPKNGFSTLDQSFQARFSITVNNEGYIPLLELLIEISDSGHPLNPIFRGCKIYGPELIGYSADSAIVYLNSSALSKERMKAITALFIDRIDKFAALAIPCGMQQVSSSLGYAEIPNGATSSYGMHRAEIIIYALEEYYKEGTSSLQLALKHAYKHYGLKIDSPALCAKAT